MNLLVPKKKGEFNPRVLGTGLRQMFYQNHLPMAGIIKQNVLTAGFGKSEIVMLCIVSRLFVAILTR